MKDWLVRGMLFGLSVSVFSRFRYSAIAFIFCDASSIDFGSARAFFSCVSFSASSMLFTYWFNCICPLKPLNPQYGTERLMESLFSLKSVSDSLPVRKSATIAFRSGTASFLCWSKVPNGILTFLSSTIESFLKSSK